MANRREVSFGVALLAVASAVPLGCREPAPVPDDLIKQAEQARAAAASAAALASAATPPPVEVKKEPVLDTFTATAPSAVCSPQPSDSCSLDAVGANAAADLNTVSREGTVTLVGWAADGVTATVPSVILVELAGEKKKFYAAATRVSKRPDVAAALKQPAFVDSGYDALTSLKDVEPGEYAIHVVQVTSAGNTISCDTRRKLKVE